MRLDVRTFRLLREPLRIGGGVALLWRVAEQARIQVPTRMSAAISWEFDHPEAGPAPPGGGPTG